MKKWVIDRLVHLFSRYPKTFICFVLVYVVWPYDLLPEGILGPVGVGDDILVAALPYLLYRYLKKRKEPSKQ